MFLKCYDHRCDLWSLGVTIFQLLSSQLPFEITDLGSAYNEIMGKKLEFKSHVWNLISSEAKQFVSQLLQKDPKRRLSAKDAIQHPWLQRAPNIVYLDSDLRESCVNNFIKFRVTNKLQETALSYISNQILYKSLSEDLYSIFKNIDTNGDGLLSRVTSPPFLQKPLV